METHKQPVAILLTDLKPEHELPVADEAIELGQPVRWNRVHPERVWPSSAYLGNAFGIALNAAAKGETVKIAPIHFGTVSGPTTVRVDLTTMGKPDLARVIVLEDLKEPRSLTRILYHEYDAKLHELPTAIERIRASNSVSFTLQNGFVQVALFDQSLNPYDAFYKVMAGVALNNADEGEGVYVLVHGSFKDVTSMRIAVFVKEAADDPPQT